MHCLCTHAGTDCVDMYVICMFMSYWGAGTGGARKLGSVDPVAGGSQARATVPGKKATTDQLRDKRAAYFNKMFAAEVAGGDDV